MFFKLLPEPLGATDVARLGVLVTTTQKNDYLSATQTIIDAETWTESNSQLIHAEPHGFKITEIPAAHPGQTCIHCHLHSSVTKGIEPLVKRDKFTLKLKLLNFFSATD